MTGDCAARAPELRGEAPTLRCWLFVCAWGTKMPKQSPRADPSRHSSWPVPDSALGFLRWKSPEILSHAAFVTLNLNVGTLTSGAKEDGVVH